MFQYTVVFVGVWWFGKRKQVPFIRLSYLSCQKQLRYPLLVSLERGVVPESSLLWLILHGHKLRTNFQSNSARQIKNCCFISPLSHILSLFVGCLVFCYLCSWDIFLHPLCCSIISYFDLHLQQREIILTLNCEYILIYAKRQKTVLGPEYLSPLLR